MPEPFDPFYKWLGIPADEQPADFYRMLGLKRFEENREVISNAADQRMAHIRSFQSGPNGRESQKVLNELSKAAGCLLNPRRKAMYDQHLRSAEIAAAQEKALLPPASEASPLSSESSNEFEIQVIPNRPTGSPPPRKRVVRTRTRGVLVWFAVGAVASVAIVATAILVIARNEKPLALPANAGLPVVGPGQNSVIAEGTPNTAGILGGTAQAIGGEIDQGGKKPAEPVVKTVAGTADNKPHPDTKPEPAGTAGTKTAVTNSSPAGTGSVPTANTSPSTGVVASPLPPVVAGKPKALHFGRTDHIEIANSIGLINPTKPFCVEMWVRFAPSESAHWLCGDLVIGPNHPNVGGGMVVGWQLFIQQTVNGQHRLGVSAREGYAVDFPASENSWHHLALSNDTQQLALFVDGRRMPSRASEQLVQSFAPSPIPLYFGAHPYLHANQSPGFVGDLRAFRVSSVARYVNPFMPGAVFEKDADTEVLLDFEAPAESKLPDLSGHGHEGMLHGGKWFGTDPLSAPNLAVTAPTAPATSAKPTPVPSVPPEKAAQNPVIAREPIPDEQAIAKAREQVRSVFREEFEKAKEPRLQAALADKLRAVAADSQDDAASRYAMMDEAEKLAAHSGDLSKALSLIDDMARRFEMDMPQRKVAAVESVVSVVKTPVERRRLAEVALSVVDEMVVAGRFDLAGELIQAAMTQAQRAKEADLAKVARELRDEINAAKKAQAPALAAKEQLADKPDDYALNLKWGRFVCFHQHDWEQGLPYLAKGNLDALSAAAKLDLASPTESDKRAEVGRTWAEAVKVVDAAEKVGVLRRALYWSRQAEPNLKGLAKAEIEKRIKELEGELPPRYRNVSSKPSKSPANVAPFQPPREVIGLLGRIQTNGVDAGVLWKYEAGLRLTNQSITDVLMQANVARGKLHIEFVGLLYLAESTTVNVTQAGGSPNATANVFIDNKQLGEVGGNRANSDVYKIDLNAGEHTIRWVLAGDDLGNSSLAFTNAATAQPLPAYHSPQLLQLVREKPTRARLNVNMLRN